MKLALFRPAVVLFITFFATTLYSAPSQFNEALLGAIQKGDLNGVKIAVAAGADVNYRNSFEATPLMLAVQQGHAAMVEWLLKEGALISARDRNGFTPLLYCAQNGSSSIFRLLIERLTPTVDPKSGETVAPVNQYRDLAGRSALRIAIESRHRVLAEEMIAAQANVNDRDSSGRTPLMWLVEMERGIPQKLDSGQWLKRLGGDVNYRDKEDSTGLMRAARNSWAPELSVWLTLGADVNLTRVFSPAIKGATERPEETALTNAIRVGDWRSVELLLGAPGLDPNVPGERNILPFIELLKAQKPTLAERLLVLGFRVNTVDFFGDTALIAALNTRNPAIASKIIAMGGVDPNLTGSNSSPLIAAIQGGYSEIALKLLEMGAKAETSIALGITPLMVAVQKGEVKIVQDLIRRGASVGPISGAGETALTIASKLNNAEIVRALLNAGADADAKDGSGTSVLANAVMNPSKEVFGEIVSAPKVNRNAFDTAQSSAFGGLILPQAYTPLMRAVIIGDLERVRMLLRYGALVNLIGTLGLNAFNYASLQLEREILGKNGKGQFREIADALLAAGAEVVKVEEGVSSLLLADAAITLEMCGYRYQRLDESRYVYSKEESWKFATIRGIEKMTPPAPPAKVVSKPQPALHPEVHPPRAVPQKPSPKPVPHRPRSSPRNDGSYRGRNGDAYRGTPPPAKPSPKNPGGHYSKPPRRR